SRADLLSSRRTANVVRPRQVAMYLAKTLTLRSLPEIGRRFGGRDHTTELHAVRKIENLVGTNSALAEEIELQKRQLPEESHASMSPGYAKRKQTWAVGDVRVPRSIPRVGGGPPRGELLPNALGKCGPDRRRPCEKRAHASTSLPLSRTPTRAGGWKQ